ncbi:MAG TPA: hypothetical protein VF050_11385 [Moraxellaceae bacterium]
MKRVALVVIAGLSPFLLGSCASTSVSGGVSVGTGWYGPWPYDPAWYGNSGTVIVGPPPRPRPPGPRPGPGPRPMPHGGGGFRR